jgi:hypothetical protein
VNIPTFQDTKTCPIVLSVSLNSADRENYSRNSCFEVPSVSSVVPPEACLPFAVVRLKNRRYRCSSSLARNPVTIRAVLTR